MSNHIEIVPQLNIGSKFWLQFLGLDESKFLPHPQYPLARILPRDIVGTDQGTPPEIQAWAESKGVSKGLLDDADKDSLTLLEEYAMGTDPNGYDQFYPAVTWNFGAATMTIEESTNPNLMPGIKWVREVGDGHSLWQPAVEGTDFDVAVVWNDGYRNRRVLSNKHSSKSEPNLAFLHLKLVADL